MYKNLVWREAVDLYAIAVSINGKFGVVFNKEKIVVPTVKLPLLEKKTDAIIYEAHISNFRIIQRAVWFIKGNTMHG